MVGTIIMIIIGMVQGHFKDLVKIFDLYGHPDKVNYLFLESKLK